MLGTILIVVLLLLLARRLAGLALQRAGATTRPARWAWCWWWCWCWRCWAEFDDSTSDCDAMAKKKLLEDIKARPAAFIACPAT